MNNFTSNLKMRVNSNSRHSLKGNKVVKNSNGELGICFGTHTTVNYKGNKISFWELSEQEQREYIQSEFEAGRYINE